MDGDPSQSLRHGLIEHLAGLGHATQVLIGSRQVAVHDYLTRSELERLEAILQRLFELAVDVVRVAEIHKGM